MTCTVLPSIRKDRTYQVRVCCTVPAGADVSTDVRAAYCICPAGLAELCNHVAALLCGLEDFGRSGLKERAAKTCTEKLKAWNRPRARKSSQGKSARSFSSNKNFRSVRQSGFESGSPTMTHGPSVSVYLWLTKWKICLKICEQHTLNLGNINPVRLSSMALLACSSCSSAPLHQAALGTRRLILIRIHQGLKTAWLKRVSKMFTTRTKLEL